MDTRVRTIMCRARRPRRTAKLSERFHTVLFLSLFCLVLITTMVSPVRPISQSKDQILDEKVQAFLKSHRHSWRDSNVPESDGKVLYDLIIQHNYTKALEIGTSTGHSGIWIAWALSKTGGKLLTVEIDKDRYQEARAHFAEAGLSDFIDARLANAHELIPQLEGPFDFVFCDADKNWYKNYLIDVFPKLEVGGCFTAHNVSGRRQRGIGDFLEYLESLPTMETTIDRSSWSGISISYKKAEK